MIESFKTIVTGMKSYIKKTVSNEISKLDKKFVQSDFNTKDSANLSFVKNKPFYDYGEEIKEIAICQPYYNTYSPVYDTNRNYNALIENETYSIYVNGVLYKENVLAVKKTQHGIENLLSLDDIIYYVDYNTVNTNEYDHRYMCYFDNIYTFPLKIKIVGKFHNYKPLTSNFIDKRGIVTSIDNKMGDLTSEKLKLVKYSTYGFNEDYKSIYSDKIEFKNGYIGLDTYSNNFKLSYGYDDNYYFNQKNGKISDGCVVKYDYIKKYIFENSMGKIKNNTLYIEYEQYKTIIKSIDNNFGSVIQYNNSFYYKENDTFYPFVKVKYKPNVNIYADFSFNINSVEKHVYIFDSKTKLDAEFNKV